MRSVKARYANGKVSLPTGFAGHPACEVTILFPNEEGRTAESEGERFRRSAGAWRKLDTEGMKKRIGESRRVSLRRRPAW